MKTVHYFFTLIALGLFLTVRGAPLDEKFGYVDVRPGAHMFWVSYEVDQVGGSWTDYPLILWLQGGPGSSGVGYGNFWELGPYYVDYSLRAHAWTQKANLMFVDNPVGSGYSYVDDESLLTTTNLEIANDLVELLTNVYEQYPEFQVMPFYVYAESYGGKMAVDFGLQLLNAIDAGNIICDFKGVAMIDSWISPMDFVNTWAPFLDSLGFVNEQERERIENQANNTQTQVDQGNWVEATNAWYATELVILQTTGGINFYNVHAEEDIYAITAQATLDGISPKIRDLLASDQPANASLNDLMNSAEQRSRWNIPPEVLSWGFQGDATFNTLAGDFMKPVVDSVVALLETERVHVAVITGNLDLICDTPGTYRWVDNMPWLKFAQWNEVGRVNERVPEYSAIAYYYQRFEEFSMFTLLRSGHMTPMDVPTGSLDIIDTIAGFANEIQSN